MQERELEPPFHMAGENDVPKGKMAGVISAERAFWLRTQKGIGYGTQQLGRKGWERSYR